MGHEVREDDRYRRLEESVRRMATTRRVCDLVPGDILVGPDGERGTFIQKAPHPIWPSLMLVIWRMEHGEWHHDALSILQELPGTVEPIQPAERLENLRDALLYKEGRD